MRRNDTRPAGTDRNERRTDHGPIDAARAETTPRIADDDLARLIRSAGPRPQPPAEHYRSVLVASRAAWQAKVAARRRRRRSYAVAASLVLVAAAVGLYQSLLPDTAGPAATAQVLRGDVAIFSAEHGVWRPLTEAAAVYAGDSVRTSATGRAAFALASGASLRLDVATEIRVTDLASIRLADGAVYVDSDDASRDSALRIETRFGDVRDIGTQFEAASRDDALRIRVRSGSVEVRRPQRGGAVHGLSGEQLEITTRGVQRRPFPPQHEDWSWVQTLAAVPELENPTVLGYLRWIARETGRELRFDSPGTEARAEAERWLGEADGLTPTEVLDAIAVTTDFSYAIAADGALLVSRRPGR